MRSQRAPSLARAEAQPAEPEATQPKGRSPVTSSAFPRNSAPQGKAWRTLSVEPPHNIIPPLHHCRFKNHLRRKNNPPGRKSELERGGAPLLPRDRDPAIERGIRKEFSQHTPESKSIGFWLCLVFSVGRRVRMDDFVTLANASLALIEIATLFFNAELHPLFF